MSSQTASQIALWQPKETALKSLHLLTKTQAKAFSVHTILVRSVLMKAGSQRTANHVLNKDTFGRVMKAYSRSAYKERTIPARQNPSKNLSVLNMVTFTESATVSPNIKMNITEKSSTGRRPTLKMKDGETLLKAKIDIMIHH